MLKFKIKKIQLEKLLFKVTKQKVYIYFKNIVDIINVKKVIKVPKLSKM